MQTHDPFAHTPPNEITAPKFNAIVTAWAAATEVLTNAMMDPNKHGSSVAFDSISGSCAALHDIISAEAPDCADRERALLNCRLACMAANEVVRNVLTAYSIPGRQAILYLYEAKWLACAAVALRWGTSKPAANE